MEPWVIIVILISICMSVVIKSIFDIAFTSRKHLCRLPPGPSTFPVVGPFLWLRLSAFELEQSLRSIQAKFGPIVTLWIGFRPAIFISDRSLVHQALIQNGAIFASRPEPLLTNKSLNISSAFYGSRWRLLRRNLTSEILHPSRIKSYTAARNWVLEILLDRFKSGYESGNPVYVLEHFQHAMFCLLVLICFGDKLKTEQIQRIEDVHRNLLLNIGRFNTLNFMPSVTKIIFGKKWQELRQLRRNQEHVLIPIIKARRNKIQESTNEHEHEHEHEYEHEHEHVLAYVDTLFDFRLPEENRLLEEEEIVTLCSEFLSAGTDTTSTALQWVMANLVKDQNIQEKLYMEIKSVMGERSTETVKEGDLHNMPYLKAVILESLRRHPPAHFVVPHAVTEDVVLDGYLVPKKATINFMVAEMGWDSKVWENPMEFKPERFLSSSNCEIDQGFDITCSREIKMMPFGAGRRICPGLGLAMLHLEYFVANLIWKFNWTAVNGDDVELSEKQEFTMVMKYPLKAHVNPRF